MKKETKLALLIGGLALAGNYLKNNYDKQIINKLLSYQKNHVIKSDTQAKIYAYGFLVSSIISKNIPNKIYYLEIPVPQTSPLTAYMSNNEIDTLSVSKHIKVNKQASLTSNYQVEWYPDSEKEDRAKSTKEALADTSRTDPVSQVDSSNLNKSQKDIIKKMLKK